MRPLLHEEGLIWKTKNIDIHWNITGFLACICKDVQLDSLKKDGRTFLTVPLSIALRATHYMNILLALRVENGFDIHIQ